MFFVSKLRTATAVLRTKPVIQTAVRNGGTWYYRRRAPSPAKSVMYRAEIMGFFLWYWMLYHIYKEPEHITGHFPYPDPSQWTDEELGIPPLEDEDY